MRIFRRTAAQLCRQLVDIFSSNVVHRDQKCPGARFTEDFEIVLRQFLLLQSP